MSDQGTVGVLGLHGPTPLEAERKIIRGSFFLGPKCPAADNALIARFRFCSVSCPQMAAASPDGVFLNAPANLFQPMSDNLGQP